MNSELRMQRRTWLALLACSNSWVLAQERPLRMILPLAAGSVGDTLVRGMAPHLSRTQGRPVVPENLPGAGGMTGTAQLVRAPADGATLGLVSSSHVINPFIYRNMPYDAIQDITPVAMIGKSMMVLAVHPSLPAETTSDLLRLLKTSPGKYNYGSSGNGGVTHLPAEMLNKEAGVATRHIPYKGLGQQVTDMVGGQVEFGFVPVGVAAPLIRSGRLRAIAVTGAARSAQLPQVPTLKESGLQTYA
jgi:tripartite-type tricarboxylate transporter receptor subunit TctC